MGFKHVVRSLPVAASVSFLAAAPVFAQANVQVDGSGVRVQTPGANVAVGGAGTSGAVILGEPAAAGMEWSVRRSEDGDVIVVWEKPDTGHQTVSFTCKAAERSLRIVYHAEPARARDGMTVRVSLASEGGVAELRMTSRRFEEEMEDFFLEALTPLTPELARVLAGQSLVIRMQGDERATVLPLAGAVEGVAELVRQCGSR